MAQHLKNKIVYQFLLSFISPVLAIYIAIKSVNEKFIVFSGTFLMGLVGSNFIYLPGTDGYAHLTKGYVFYLDMSFSQFIQDSIKLLLFQPVETSSDIYKHLLSYLASSIFGVPELLHLFAGLILGYFFTKSVLLVLENKPKQKSSILLLAFITLFLIVRSVSALNSIRMWSAMWVFFYGAYAYIKRGKVKYLWVVVLAAFIHFSYLLYSIPLFMAFVLKRRKLLISTLFVLSFFVNVNYEQAKSIVQLTGLYEQKAKSTVISEKTIDERAAEGAISLEKTNFYKRLGPVMYSSFSLVLLSFVLLFVYLKKLNNVHLDFLIAGGLLLFALSNISASFSPSVSGRGVTIAGTFLTAAAIQLLFLKRELVFTRITNSIINFSFSVFLISSIPNLLFNISYAMNSVSVFFIGLPAISWVMGDQDSSVRDFIAFFIY
ncbi:EpsG family protein [Lewinella cohaerens]|jgi:hypothetical protein|uniref:EpsG family protein n=1 Tax=Lewinella cohaerens TaxID=70995 RepID=UPI00037E4862|nr:EpsG family protein [Lewinella cohaerens]